VSDFFLGAALAFWLGILTSISPCPLATNLAAVSFIGRRVESPRRVLVAGCLYTLGRTFVYVVLAALLVLAVLSVPSVSHALQKHMNKLLGPLLILVGMYLLELLQMSWGGGWGGRMGAKLQSRFERVGTGSAALLGMVFALSFCPISAALFFGSLIPLSAKLGSVIVLPFLYGVGTALPAAVFAFLLAFGAHGVGKAFNSLVQFERWARRITGVLFIGIGIYFSLVYIFRVPL
jgi:cytochrome c biogenesis protein CcdA